MPHVEDGQPAFNGTTTPHGYLIDGLLDLVDAAESPFCVDTLKPVAEVLGIFRAMALTDPLWQSLVQERLARIFPRFVSPDAVAFYLQSPLLFKLWGSILADIPFFAPEHRPLAQGVLQAADAELLLRRETIGFRRLDVLDIFKRAGADLPNMGTPDAPHLAHVFPIRLIDTSFVYHVTHLCFYLSDWGRSPQGVPPDLRANLANAARWSVSVKDADLAAECAVACSHARLDLGISQLLDLIEEMTDHRGAIARHPGSETPSFMDCYHTTLVGLWAFVSHARYRLVNQRRQPTPDPISIAPPPNEPPTPATERVERLVALYFEVDSESLSNDERTDARRALADAGHQACSIRCDDHWLDLLGQCAPSAPPIWGIAHIAYMFLLGVIAGTLCEQCAASQLEFLKEVRALLDGASGREHEMITRILDLPVVTQLHARGPCTPNRQVASTTRPSP